MKLKIRHPPRREMNSSLYIHRLNSGDLINVLLFDKESDIIWDLRWFKIGVV